jgi:hypothetical protein
LTGTYQLQPARGDDPRALADRAASQVPADRRARVSRTLVNRLTPPDILALERTGRRVSMASTRGPRATFDVDGVEREETGAAGRRVFTRATLHGDQLVVSTTGSRGGDYTVTFEPIDNGGTMRVTRAITDPDLRVPVTARSFYRRTSTQARWDLYSERPVGALGGDDPREPRGTAGGFIVPDGTRLTARLDTPLSTRTAREGDRFTLTVQGPSEYAGAVIDGIVSQVSASDRLKGRADISLSFDTIRQRGRTSPFGGMIESIRTANGESVRVDREGQIEETDSRSEKAIERGAIGAAIGAVLGAVIGGGKGAAIGAVIGAGGGAGTVIADGREQLDLARGTEITITAAAPR